MIRGLSYSFLVLHAPTPHQALQHFETIYGEMGGISLAIVLCYSSVIFLQ